MYSVAVCLFLLILVLVIGRNASLIDVIITGDWGGLPQAPFTTAIQYSNRDMMETIASQYNISAIIALGDNFYFSGVDNEYDARFQATFENVYNTASLMEIPWYFVAGNHDWGKNVSGEMFYSNHSTRWNFPFYYYSQIWQIPNSANNETLQFIGLDCVILDGTDATAAAIQYAWLEHELHISNATYILVGAHYPIYSYDYHGPTQSMIETLNPILLNTPRNVISFIAGHEHLLEFIEVPQQSMQYIISGAANFCRISPRFLNSPLNPNHMQSYKYHGCNGGGFVRLSINDEFAQMFYYLGNSDQIVYQTGRWYANQTYLSMDELLATQSPTHVPSFVPTDYPSQIPSFNPTQFPTHFPTNIPTNLPSSKSPFNVPTYVPSHLPSYQPTTIPSSRVPTFMPTEQPTFDPTRSPSIKYSGVVGHEHKSLFGIQIGANKWTFITILVALIILATVSVLAVVFYRKCKAKHLARYNMTVENLQNVDQESQDSNGIEMGTHSREPNMANTAHTAGINRHTDTNMNASAAINLGEVD